MPITFIRKARFLAFLPFFNSDENPYDVLPADKTTTEYNNESKIGRLKSLFQPHHEHPIHPLLISIIQTSFGTFFLGGIYGGIITSRITFINFIDNNEATQFRNHWDAKRQLSDKMFIGFLKGFAKWGMRISFFSTSFMMGYTILSVIQDNVSVFNYTCGGMYAGALYRFNLGPKGMISGGIIGSVFGTLYGSLKLLLFKITNTNEQYLTDKKFELKLARDELLHKARRERHLKEYSDDVNKEISNIIMKTEKD